MGQRTGSWSLSHQGNEEPREGDYLPRPLTQEMPPVRYSRSGQTYPGRTCHHQPHKKRQLLELSSCRIEFHGPHLLQSCSMLFTILLSLCLYLCHARAGLFHMCVCVCLSVCLSVYPSVPALAASASVETSKQRYSRVSLRLFLDLYVMCGVSKKPSVQKLWRGKANMQMSWSSPSAAFAQSRDQRNAAAT